MFSGCQFSLYPMTDRFVEVILGAIEGLDQREDVRVSSDDLSTLLIGPPRTLFDAVEETFLAAADDAGHAVLSATFSRGCPGEPDDPICVPEEPITASAERLLDPTAVEPAGVEVAAQFSLYPLGIENHMETIYDEIEATKEEGVFAESKHFCTRLEGDAREIFAALYNAFERAAHDAGHVVVTATVSKGSPTER